MVTGELSDYKRSLLEKRRQNALLLQDVVQEVDKIGIVPKTIKPVSKKPARSLKNRPDTKKKDVPGASRRSLRLLNIHPENLVEKQQIEDEFEQRLEAEKAKRRRRSGNLDFTEILNNSSASNFRLLKGLSVPENSSLKYEFDIEEARKSDSKHIKQTVETFSKLSLWQNVEPSKIKVVPERAYTMGFHPTESKCLVFVGDKLGTLGIFDSLESVKSDESLEEDDEPNLSITQLKVHTRPITSLQFPSGDPTKVYSSSYDSTIRKLDLEKQVTTEVFAPSDDAVEDGISYMQLAESEPNLVYFSTLNGQFGFQDLRIAAKDASGQTSYTLSDKKIGGFSIHPSKPYLLATASLDRCLRLWDLRQTTGNRENMLPYAIGEHTSRLSVSSASFNHLGHVVTASYDDTVKIHDFSLILDLAAGTISGNKALMDPKMVIPHNNQTGRWVTILKPSWQMLPSDGIQKFSIGNMNRSVDIFDSSGVQLAQLGGDDGLTAVPATASLHPTLNWVGGVNNSGKLALWI